MNKKLKAYERIVKIHIRHDKTQRTIVPALIPEAGKQAPA